MCLPRLATEEDTDSALCVNCGQLVTCCSLRSVSTHVEQEQRKAGGHRHRSRTGAQFAGTCCQPSGPTRKTATMHRLQQMPLAPSLAPRWRTASAAHFQGSSTAAPIGRRPVIVVKALQTRRVYQPGRDCFLTVAVDRAARRCLKPRPPCWPRNGGATAALIRYGPGVSTPGSCRTSSGRPWMSLWTTVRVH